MKESAEEKLKSAAGLYAKKEGESLLAEADELQRQGVSYLTPRADRTVRELAAKGRRPRRRNLAVGLAAAAACAVFAVRMVTGIAGPDSDLSTPSDTPTPSGPTAPAGPVAPDGILPISFTLPADYRVKYSDFDNGVSVYMLESGRGGDVVLTMYYASGEIDDGSGPGTGFDEVVIDGTPVPAKVNEAYKLLAFEADGLSYTLSSRDDLGALAAFYRNITESVPA